MLHFRYKKIVVIFFLLILGVVFYISQDGDVSKAKVVFFNIGQGDSSLISLPQDNQILIDGGPSEKILSSLGKYIPFYDKDIELVVLTHPHADHLRGVNHVLENYNVKNILISGSFYESGVFSKFLELLESEEAQVYIAQKGDKIFWRREKIMEVIWPDRILLGREFRNIHDSNIVSEVFLGGVKFLFTGDLEEEIEKILVNSKNLQDINVLKVGHQGSKTSSSWSFLNEILPEVAVIPVGNNSYGHPHQIVLDRLEELGSKIFRTDRDDDIVWTFRLQ